VTAEHLRTLSEATTSRKVCDALAEALRIKTSARKIPLTRELSTLQMRDGEGLMAYVGRERTLRLELAGAGHPVGENIAVVHVLAGILTAYKTVTTGFWRRVRP